MPKTSTYTLTVQFGDCDPAGIVFFPNFARWMDAAALHFFLHCGVPPWSRVEEPPGFVGAPVLEIRTRFVQSATYPDVLQVHTDIERWAAKVFVMRHRVMRGETLICEGHETRAFCTRSPEGVLKAIAVPAWIRALCDDSAP